MTLVVARRRFLLALLGAPAAALVGCGDSARRPTSSVDPLAEAALLGLERDGGASLYAVVAARRSVRAFAPRELTRAELGQVLWASQGVTDAANRRAAPSAGGLYPLELTVVDAAGVHRYRPDGHRLATMAEGDRRAALSQACHGQSAVAGAPAAIVIAAVVGRTAARYGSRAERFVALEAGHAAHGLLLAAVSLGLGGVTIGSFDDDEVADVAVLPAGASPLYVVPVGAPA